VWNHGCHYFSSWKLNVCFFFLSSIHAPEVNLLPKVVNFCRCLIRYGEHKPWIHSTYIGLTSLAIVDLVINKKNGLNSFYTSHEKLKNWFICSVHVSSYGWMGEVCWAWERRVRFAWGAAAQTLASWVLSFKLPRSIHITRYMHS